MPDHGIYEKVDIHGPVPGFIIQHTRPGSEIVKSHWHQELEINTAFEGSSRFFINGRVEDVTPQHVVLVNSREVHSSIPYFPTDGFAVTGITLQISYPFLKSLVPNYDDCYFVLTEEANKKIHSLVLALNQWYEQEDTPFLPVLVIRQICEIVYILLTQCCQERGQTGEGVSQEPFQKLEGILSYIHSHYNETLHTAQVAQQFFFSKEYFCRFFKKYTGVTFPSTWRNTGSSRQNSCFPTHPKRFPRLPRKPGLPTRAALSNISENTTAVPREIIEKRCCKIRFSVRISQFSPKEQSIPPYFLNLLHGILTV